MFDSIPIPWQSVRTHSGIYSDSKSCITALELCRTRRVGVKIFYSTCYEYEWGFQASVSLTTPCFTGHGKVYMYFPQLFQEFRAEHDRWMLRVFSCNHGELINGFAVESWDLASVWSRLSISKCYVYSVYNNVIINDHVVIWHALGHILCGSLNTTCHCLLLHSYALLCSRK